MGSCCKSCEIEVAPCEGERGCEQSSEEADGQMSYVCADRLSLNAAAGVITALEHVPVGRANAVEVGVYVFAGSGPLNGSAILQATNDLENHVTIGSIALNGLGNFVFQVTGIASSNVRVLFVINPGGASNYSVAVDCHLSRQ